MRQPLLQIIIGSTRPAAVPGGGPEAAAQRGHTEAATAMLDELARVEAVPRPLREPEAPEPETGDLDPEAEPVR